MKKSVFVLVLVFNFSLLSVYAQKASFNFQYDGQRYAIQQTIDPVKKLINQNLNLVNENGRAVTSSLMVNVIYIISLNGYQATKLPSKLRVIEEVELLYHNVKNAQFQNQYSTEIKPKEGSFSDILFIGTSDNPKTFKSVEMIKRQRIYITDNQGYRHLLVDQLIAFSWDKGIIKLIPTQEAELSMVKKLASNQIKRGIFASQIAKSQ